MYMEDNDKELIQSNSSSDARHQTGKEYKINIDSVEYDNKCEKPSGQLFSSLCPPGYC